jgi:NifU-like protein
MYTDTIHYREPRNVGKPTTFNVEGIAGDRSAGPFLALYLDVANNGVIRDAHFETYGCATAVAAGSCLTESIRGRRLDDLVITPERLSEDLGGLPLGKRHCALLAIGALAHAIVHWKRGTP